jgi:hypothetical protein
MVSASNTLEGETAYRVLMKKRERRKPLGIPICRWVDNIKIDLKTI